MSPSPVLPILSHNPLLWKPPVCFVYQSICFVCCSFICVFYIPHISEISLSLTTSLSLIQETDRHHYPVCFTDGAVSLQRLRSVPKNSCPRSRGRAMGSALPCRALQPLRASPHHILTGPESSLPKTGHMWSHQDSSLAGPVPNVWTWTGLLASLGGGCVWQDSPISKPHSSSVTQQGWVKAAEAAAPTLLWPRLSPEQVSPLGATPWDPSLETSPCTLRGQFGWGPLVMALQRKGMVVSNCAPLGQAPHPCVHFTAEKLRPGMEGV